MDCATCIKVGSRLTVQCAAFTTVGLSLLYHVVIVKRPLPYDTDRLLDGRPLALHHALICGMSTLSGTASLGPILVLVLLAIPLTTCRRETSLAAMQPQRPRSWFPEDTHCHVQTLDSRVSLNISHQRFLRASQPLGSNCRHRSRAVDGLVTAI